MFATISPEKIGENLKRLIKESEYRTQERFAEEAFVDVRTVRRWVQNGIDSISTVAMVADILDVDRKIGDYSYFTNNTIRIQDI